MLPDISVVIPTYWTRPDGEVRPGDAVYDHPTAVGQESTLGRLLSSLRILDSQRFYVLLLVAVTSPEVEDGARRQVDEMVALFPDLTIVVISDRDMERLRPLWQDLEDTTDLLGLAGYSRVRNVQLAIPQILGSSCIIALDDDEVVLNEHFLDLAVEGLGGEVDGRKVEGLSGYYLQDRSGKILLDVPPGSEVADNVFERKAAIMNEGTLALEDMPGRLVPTPFCFGGNMIFSRQLFSSVCFDPSVTRGEDIDYLINARLSGYLFFMNKDLTILHLPPSGGSYQDVAYHKVVQDVLRFLYEREKIRAASTLGTAHPVEVEELMPYPGEFLTSSLDKDSHDILEEVWNKVDDQTRIRLGLGNSVESFLEQARETAKAGVAKFSKYQSDWKELMHKLERDRDSRDLVLSLIRDQTSAAVRHASV